MQGRESWREISKLRKQCHLSGRTTPSCGLFVLLPLRYAAIRVKVRDKMENAISQSKYTGFLHGLNFIKFPLHLRERSLKYLLDSKLPNNKNSELKFQKYILIHYFTIIEHFNIKTLLMFISHQDCIGVVWSNLIDGALTFKSNCHQLKIQVLMKLLFYWNHPSPTDSWPLKESKDQKSLMWNLQNFFKKLFMSLPLLLIKTHFKWVNSVLYHLFKNCFELILILFILLIW